MTFRTPQQGNTRLSAYTWALIIEQAEKDGTTPRKVLEDLVLQSLDNINARSKYLEAHPDDRVSALSATQPPKTPTQFNRYQGLHLSAQPSEGEERFVSFAGYVERWTFSKGFWYLAGTRYPDKE